MNPNVSLNWFEVAFPVFMTMVVGIELWRRSPAREDRLAMFGFVGIVLALAGASLANFFYQGALHARAWPTIGMYDQVVVTQAGDVFIKVKDPIMERSSRVQRYSCRGAFKSAFQPDVAGGLFKISLNPDDTLSVYSVRTDTIDIFNVDGTFLGRREMDSQEMPFDFLKSGPSVTKVDGCEFMIDPASGWPAVKDSTGIWPLDRGDWALEHALNRQNIMGSALLGGLMLAISFIRTRSRSAASSG